MREKRDRSKKDGNGMYNVQFYTRQILSWVLPILRRIEAEDYSARIALEFKCSRQHVQHYIKRLIDTNLIYQEKRSSHAVYCLTDRGKALLKSCEGRTFPGELLRLDKGQIAFPIVREGVYPKGNFKMVEMVNWTALLGLELGVKVRHTSKSWIVHVPVLRGKSQIEIASLAMNLANRVAIALSKKYGVVLSEGKSIAGEVAIEDPVAKVVGKYVIIRTPHRKIDHSWGEGELENLSKDAVIDYLKMPEAVREIHEKVDRIERRVDQLMSIVGSPNESDPEQVAEGQRRLGEYVS